MSSLRESQSNLRKAFYGGIALGLMPMSWHIIFAVVCDIGVNCSNTILWSVQDPTWVTDILFIGLGLSTTAFIGGLRLGLLARIIHGAA